MPTATLTAAQQIAQVAADLKWPAGWPGDVEIDKRNLDEQDPGTFAWFITAEYGTYLILTAAMLDTVRSCAGERRGNLYIFRQGRLRPARSWEAARDILAAVPSAQRKPAYKWIY